MAFQLSSIWFYGTETIAGYLMPNPFLYIETVPLKITLIYKEIEASTKIPVLPN